MHEIEFCLKVVGNCLVALTNNSMTTTTMSIFLVSRLHYSDCLAITLLMRYALDGEATRDLGERRIQMLHVNDYWLF